ncbi:hypothetical protein [Sphingomonas sp. MMS24-J13]|uniref:hypothetical protein n=1 Tax=Sphingomonas sp. MMS24-J13 TaxID=3238686 RepID=UPI00384FA28C
MGELSSLERAAIAAILEEMGEQRALLEQQMLQAKVRSRENTGGGFVTELEVGSTADSLGKKTAPLGQNVWISIDGLNFGLGMILHLKEGRADLLEGYAVGPEDTSLIDFEHVPYAMTEEPGPLRRNGS